MDKKLTDSEIIEILNICVNKDDVFVLHNNAETREYDKVTIKDILGVIESLQAENEVLEARIGVYETCNARKDEAIKHLEAENERLNKLAELGNMRANDYRVMRDRALKAEAEIERLKKSLEQCEDNGEYWESKYKTAKAEAYKEFAKSIHKAITDYKDKKEMPMLPYTGYALDYVEEKIDNLLKELVGDK
jgi:chromosome segregation ATPase